jgi:hypothetical protein
MLKMEKQKQMQLSLSFPEMAMVVGTRAFLGAGVGLLAAGLLPEEQRKVIGWTLVGIGALTTIPLAFEVLGKREISSQKLIN